MIKSEKLKRKKNHTYTGSPVFKKNNNNILTAKYINPSKLIIHTDNSWAHTHTHQLWDQLWPWGMASRHTATQFITPFIVNCFTVSTSKKQYSIRAIYSLSDRSVTPQCNTNTQCCYVDQCFNSYDWMNVGHTLMDTVAPSVCTWWTGLFTFSNGMQWGICT